MYLNFSKHLYFTYPSDRVSTFYRLGMLAHHIFISFKSYITLITVFEIPSFDFLDF